MGRNNNSGLGFVNKTGLPEKIMARTPSRKTLKRNLDEYTALVVKERDGYICQKCGKKCSGQGAHWSHIYSRQRFSMRWLLLNAICLCAGCHRWWHDNPTESGVWFKDKWPYRDEHLQQERRRPPRTIRTSELVKWLELMKQKYKELIKENPK